jgi:hypothetical protein
MPARPRQHDDDRDSMTTLSPARTCTLGLFTSSPKVTPSSSFDAAVNTRVDALIHHSHCHPSVGRSGPDGAGDRRDLPRPTQRLEDAKDEPGAADFYYGEMEMRRLAARGRDHEDTDGGGAKGRRPSWTERRLLDAYWAVSGYGLRAWRALTALTILLVGCAALFTLPAFAHLPAVPSMCRLWTCEQGRSGTRREVSPASNPTLALQSHSGHRWNSPRRRALR